MRLRVRKSITSIRGLRLRSNNENEKRECIQSDNPSNTRRHKNAEPEPPFREFTLSLGKSLKLKFSMKTRYSFEKRSAENSCVVGLFDDRRTDQTIERIILRVIVVP